MSKKVKKDLRKIYGKCDPGPCKETYIVTEGWMRFRKCDHQIIERFYHSIPSIKDEYYCTLKKLK